MVDYCLKCRKQDPYERILLWLNDLELNQLYPIPVTQDAILLDIDDKEQEERKTPILPPLKVPPHKQSQSDVAPSRKQSVGDITSSNKQGQATPRI